MTSHFLSGDVGYKRHSNRLWLNRCQSLPVRAHRIPFSVLFPTILWAEWLKKFQQNKIKYKGSHFQKLFGNIIKNNNFNIPFRVWEGWVTDDWLTWQAPPHFYWPSINQIKKNGKKKKGKKHFFLFQVTVKAWLYPRLFCHRRKLIGPVQFWLSSQISDWIVKVEMRDHYYPYQSVTTVAVVIEGTWMIS